MALESAKKIQLNRITYSVRASQAVLQYGVGAMVDFQSQTLMTAAPEYWENQVIEMRCAIGREFPMCVSLNGIFVLNAENFNRLKTG